MTVRAFNDDPGGTMPGADVALKEWLEHESHTGDLLAIRNQLVTTYGVTFVATVLTEKALGEGMPIAYIFTNAFRHVGTETKRDVIAYQTDIHIFANGCIDTQAMDPFAAYRDCQRIANGIASMVVRTGCQAVNDWDEYANGEPVQIVSSALAQDSLDSEQWPHARWELGISWEHDGIVYP